MPNPEFSGTGGHARLYARLPAHRARERARERADIPHDLLAMPLLVSARDLPPARHAHSPNAARALLSAARCAHACARRPAPHDCRLLAACTVCARAAAVVNQIALK